MEADKFALSYCRTRLPAETTPRGHMKGCRRAQVGLTHSRTQGKVVAMKAVTECDLKCGKRPRVFFGVRVQMKPRCLSPSPPRDRRAHAVQSSTPHYAMRGRVSWCSFEKVW